MNIRVLIIDASILSRNILELLLSPITTQMGFSEDLTILEVINDFNIIVINSNTIKTKFSDFEKMLISNQSIIKIPKIFIIDKKEKELIKSIEQLKKTWIITKPFFPDDIVLLVKKLCKLKK